MFKNPVEEYNEKVNQSKKIFIGVITLIFVGGAIYWYATQIINSGCHLSGGGTDGSVTSYFNEALEEGFIEKKGGRPIEGFEPFMFMEVYPGLHPGDFSCVSAYGGLYVVSGEQIVFNLYKSIISKRSTAERSVTAPGMSRLLQNIVERLNRPLPRTEAEADDIIRSISF